MSATKTHDFRQGFQPAGGSGKGARNFQQSSTRNRNLSLPGPVLGDQWGFSAGWGIPFDSLSGGGPVFTDVFQYYVGPLFGPLQNGTGYPEPTEPTIKGIPWYPIVKDFTYSDQIYSCYGFSPPGNWTVQSFSMIRPGKYTLTWSGIGLTQTFASDTATGTVQVYAVPGFNTSGILIGTFAAGAQAQLMPTFDSRDFFGSAVFWTIYFVITGAGPTYPTIENDVAGVGKFLYIKEDDSGGDPSGVINVNIFGTRIS